MAGYSGTPLPTKLGLRPGHLVAVLGAPDDFATTLGALPERVTLRTSLRGTKPLDVVLLFTTARGELETRFARAKDRIVADGGVWVCWPKRASGVPTDVTEDVVREIALPTGMVDNKVCAIDATWSGLRLVWRKELRGARPGGASSPESAGVR